MTDNNTQAAECLSRLTAELGTTSDESRITIRVRLPKDENERLYAALNSTANDLYPQDDGRVLVTGKNKEGEIIELGCIDESALYANKTNAHDLINKVRFGV